MAFGNRGAKTDETICHAWAHQTTSDMHKNSMFFSGRTIYSYGNHFPIATILKDDDHTVLFTTRDYSPATSAHKWKARSAVSHKNIIYCPHVPDSSSGTFSKWNHDKNIEAWTEEVKYKMDELAKARQQRTKDRLIGELDAIQEQAKVYIEYFKLKLLKAQKEKLFMKDVEGYKESLKRADIAAKRKATALLNKGKKLHPEWLKQWRIFNESEFLRDLSYDLRNAIQSVEFKDGNYNKVRLRIRLDDAGDTFTAVIHTSKGIKIPANIAKRYYDKYLAVVAKGGCSNTCGYKMLDYEVTEMNADHLLVGCHDISRSEIDYVAEKLGWVSETSALDKFIESADMPQ